MVKIKDVLKLRKEIIFGGAVQTEWFYSEKANSISSNFVFHGPDFFGVTEEDIEFTSHKLMDTCTYCDLISDRLSSEEGNPIILTIAGYGTGKSHLSVTLGTLFSRDNNDKITQKILSNMRMADSRIVQKVESRLDKPNLVLVLNGMKDFNLNYELIACMKKSLKNWGYNEEIFSEFTKAYNIAFNFLEKNYDIFKDSFERNAKLHNISNCNLKEYMKENIYEDEVFDSINEVYNEVVGTYIKWDDGISASEVLKKLSEKLCGDKRKFNKILILFDEFGRYIEYAAEYPNRAGDSALQQLFEVIQDSNNNIILNAFIQSDLKTYLARVNKTSNISRYIGRYEVGEKIYLSSNLETIFSNLISKSNKSLYDNLIRRYYNKQDVEEYNKLIFNKMQRWIEGVNSRGIWKNYDKYKNVILEGIYPLNPFATWLITYLSDWYQQRSALNFLVKSFESIQEKELNELGDLPEIKAIDIIKGDLFEELLLAESEGRQKSEYCTVYEKILVKYGDKLRPLEKDVLAGILVLKLCKFQNDNKENLDFSLEVVTGIKKSIIGQVILELEDIYGVISYDERNFTYDFIEDATGKNDFLRMLRKKKNDIVINIDSLITTDVYEKIGIKLLNDTIFGKKNHIKTSEWRYETEFLLADDINELKISSIIKSFKGKTTPDLAKGTLLYVYNNDMQESNALDNIVRLHKRFKLKNYPIIFLLIDDYNNNLYESLVNNYISKRFTEEDNMKFAKYINRFINENEVNMQKQFKQLLDKKLYIEEDGVVEIQQRIQTVCNNRFEYLYPNIISFDFAAFDNKSIATPKKIHATISKCIVQNSLNYQTLSTWNSDVVNRVKAVLESPRSGWGVVSLRGNEVVVSQPQNMKAKNIYDLLDYKFYNNGEIDFKEIFNLLTYPPYGLNDYAISLFISIYIATKHYESKLKLNDNIINNTQWANTIFTDKGLSYSNLEKSKLVKIDIDGYKLKYQKLCKDIDNNKDIDKVKKLDNELRILMNESEPPEEFKEKVSGCILILEQGLKLYERVNRNLAELAGKLEDGIETKDYKKIIKAVVESDNVTECIEENSRFIYNERYALGYEKINKQGRKAIELGYQDYLKKECTCRAVAQATKYETWMRGMASDLENIGYIILSQKTKLRLENELDNLQLIKERQNVEVNVRSFVEKKVTEFTTQEELMAIEKEGKHLLDLLESNTKISKRDKQEFITRVKMLISKTNGYLQKIKDSITEIYDKSYDVKTISDIKEIKSMIDYILSKKLRREDKEDIEIIGNDIQNFINDINEINIVRDIEIKIKLVEDLKIKYEECESIEFNIVIDNYLEEIKQILSKESEAWCSKYLTLDNMKISEMKSEECYVWIRDTKNKPKYLNDSDMERYNDILVLIKDRMCKLKIDSIVVMFNDLVKEEKEICLNRLKENI